MAFLTVWFIGDITNLAGELTDEHAEKDGRAVSTTMISISMTLISTSYQIIPIGDVHVRILILIHLQVRFGQVSSLQSLS